MKRRAALLSESGKLESVAGKTIPFDNTYARLSERFFARVKPTPVARPQLIAVNEELASELSMDASWLRSEEGLQVLAGNAIADGSEPLAEAYAGHQFGHFVPQLGDGRANLLGEVVSRSGIRYDIQLKGAGPTPFSRRGDGRAALGPVLREYVLSEAMTALGIPSTRALAAVTTGEWVQRERAMPGAILTRVAQSHIRVGTFQYFAAREDTESLRTLLHYAIARHYPEIATREKPCRAFLDAVIARQAALIARWMLVGFIHGVMNTDNMAISGETIDFGPCAFMEAYEPTKVYSSIDHRGRYAYGNQANAALWNLTRLAESLLPLLADEAGGEDAALASANEALSRFESQFLERYRGGLRQKIGLGENREGDDALADALLQAMEANGADFTLTFRRLCDVSAAMSDSTSARGKAGDAVRSGFRDPQAFDKWSAQWVERLAVEPGTMGERAATMRLTNPAYIPRNHRVEAMIVAAVERQDFAPFAELLSVVTQPFAERDEDARYLKPAAPEECVLETFCGT